MSAPYSHAPLGGHLKVLKWAREHHCPWNSLKRVCMRCCERAPGGVEVGGGARLPVGCERVCTRRRCRRVRGGGAVGEGSTRALNHTHPPAGSNAGRTTAMHFRQDLQCTAQARG